MVSTSVGLSLIVVGLLLGGAVAYVVLTSSQIRSTTLFSTTTTTDISSITFSSHTTIKLVSYLATTRTITETTTTVSTAGSGPVVILGASISSTLPQTGFAISCSTTLNSSSYVAVENNGTGTITINALGLSYGKAAYTAGYVPCSVSAGAVVYIKILGLSATASLGEPYTTIVIYDVHSGASFKNTFY